jgi:mannonate dehydratase
MLQSWRWFGPRDPISLTKIRQAGASGIVTALHDIPAGEVWPKAAIAERKALIEAHGMRWSVVESLPVPTAVRLAEPGHERYIERYQESMANLGELGVKAICYNFMPVIDWTRTDLEWRAPDGSISLRFESAAWVAFDVFLLQRPGAEAEYDQKQLDAGRRYFEALGSEGRERLVRTVAAGLPGANEKGYSLEGLRKELERWQSVTPDVLRSRLVAFLKAVVPVCERYDLRLCIHPDDPPRPLLGLPRIASCQMDFDALFAAVPSEANGLTLCVGSLTAGRHNDASALVRHFAPRIHFAHLRTVLLEDDDSFVEADHLAGDANLVDVGRVLVAEERRRRAAGLAHAEIAMRPDHGRVLEGDIADLPGYPWLGRLKALAELRGMLVAIEQLT